MFVEYDKINVEYVYEDLRYIDNEVIKGSALGIDIGLNNLCAITSNCEELSYIVNGRPLKSINQFWNKKVKELTQLLKTSYSKDVRIDGDDTPSKEKREFTQKKFRKNFKPKKTSKMIQAVSRNRNNRIETYLHQVA